MRLWSISFSYLDSIGLVALWRESLLAKAVLEGKTKGYTMHPQLERFKNSNEPLKSINSYLKYVLDEAMTRGYSFDPAKVDMGLVDTNIRIDVTQGQLDYELEHLKGKLKKRSPKDYIRLKGIEKAEPVGLFRAVKGGVEAWEKI